MCRAVCYVILGVFLGLLPGAGHAAQVPYYLHFTVQDSTDHFIPIGEVEFCPPQGKCVYADINRGSPGVFKLRSGDLVPGQTYIVMIYTMDVQVIFEMRDWVYNPEDYDPGWDVVLDTNKFLIYPQFHGTKDGRLKFWVDTTLNPQWEERAGRQPLSVMPDTLAFPKGLVSFEVPFMLGGKFTSDDEAAGGVPAVKPGWGLTAAYRFGYPLRAPDKDKWVSFQTVMLSYAQNRYDTNEVLYPGIISDVTFHRLTLAYGFGRMNQGHTAHWSVAGAVGYGGVYDRTHVLKYLGRSYTMFGFGVRARYLRQFTSGGGIDVGLVGAVEAMYYPADAADSDFWYGLAPSASIGVVIY